MVWRTVAIKIDFGRTTKQNIKMDLLVLLLMLWLVWTQIHRMTFIILPVAIAIARNVSIHLFFLFVRLFVFFLIYSFAIVEQQKTSNKHPFLFIIVAVRSFTLSLSFLLKRAQYTMFRCYSCWITNNMNPSGIDVFFSFYNFFIIIFYLSFLFGHWLSICAKTMANWLNLSFGEFSYFHIFETTNDSRLGDFRSIVAYFVLLSYQTELVGGANYGCHNLVFASSTPNTSINKIFLVFFNCISSSIHFKHTQPYNDEHIRHNSIIQSNYKLSVILVRSTSAHTQKHVHRLSEWQVIEMAHTCEKMLVGLKRTQFLLHHFRFSHFRFSIELGNRMKQNKATTTTRPTTFEISGRCRAKRKTHTKFAWLWK